MTDTSKKFYVYVHKYASGPKKGQVFYVGKGSGDRWKIVSRRSQYWNNIKRKYGITSEILIHFDSEVCAFSLEVAIISFIGRSNLCNMTDGGEGTHGFVRSEEFKVEMSNKRRGRLNPMYGRTGSKNPFYGKKHSMETIDNMSGANNHFYGVYGVDHPRFGIPHTDETKRKISKSNSGRKLSGEHKQKITNGMLGKGLMPVVTDCGMTFKGRKFAVEWLRRNGHPKANGSSITQCCKGKLNTAYGFGWSYKDE
ncbi:MAG: hypothetical protein GY820_00115 [Gammaproteobacteria bacterium]|nr:hypothetical protein [Gammaproteobacteria bacterium]